MLNEDVKVPSIKHLLEAGGMGGPKGEDETTNILEVW